MMKSILVCLLVVASVAALDQPITEKEQDNKAAYPETVITPSSPGPRAAITTSREEQKPASQSVTILGQEKAAYPAVTIQQEQPAAYPQVIVSDQEQKTANVETSAAPLTAGLSSEALERIEQRSNIVEQTSNNIDEQIQIPIPTPYPVTYERRIPITVNKPIPVSVPRAVQVQVSQPYPVEVPRAVPVSVPRAVPVSVPYAVPQQYAVPQPYAVPQYYAAPQYYTAPQHYAVPQAPVRSYAVAAPQVTPAPVFSQYSYPSFNFQSARYAAPLQASSQLLSTRQTLIPTTQSPAQLQTIIPTQSPLVSLPQSLRFNSAALPNPEIIYNGAPTTYITPRPYFAQPDVSFHQPLFSARHFNVELSPLAPTTVAPITLDSVSTITPAPIALNSLSTVTPTPLPFALDTVQTVYDGPSHAYLPPPTIFKKK